MTPLTPFGKAIKILRMDAGISQKEMAQDLGVSSTFLSNMEMGRNKINPDWVEKISEYFHRRGAPVPSNLPEMADATNGFVSLAGLSLEHQFLVSRMARAQLTQDQLTQLAECLDSVKSRGAAFVDPL
jgi:transcriptional regulator with XRE-family HTH domain